MQKRKSKINKFLKEFFSPKKGKIILTVILMIMFFYFLLTGIEQVVVLFYLPLIISGPLNIYTSGGFDTVITPTIFSVIAALLIYALQTYVISCLLILIYNKIRGLYKKNVQNK